MYSVPDRVPGAERARWLAELSEKLGEARQLIRNLELNGDQRRVAEELNHRIEAAMQEVHSLRLGRSLQKADNFYPKWSNPLPWTSRGCGGI